MNHRPRVMARGALLACALASGASAGAAAQEAPLDDEQLTRFARAYVATSAAKEEFHASIARVHDQEGRIRARQEMEAELVRILAEHYLTEQTYVEITLLVSVNAEARARFEATLRRLAEAPGGA